MSQVIARPDIDPDEIQNLDSAKGAAETLRKAIRYHDYRYYVLDDPVISDLEHWTRDSVKRLVERHGGRATSSVSGNTDYVIVGSNSGSKISDAEANDVSVWDEATFINFLREKVIDVT
jgi:NAD-dependent DNA ligase